MNSEIYEMPSEAEVDNFDVIRQRVVPIAPASPSSVAAHPAIALFHGFDLEGRPLVRGIDGLPGEIVATRTTIPLRSDLVGHEVLVVFANGEVRSPIIVGVLDVPEAGNPVAPIDALIDSRRVRIEAEQEISLVCGDASITLTRGGKVVISGNYVVSRSTGYNRIKGSAVDIN